MPRQFRFLGLWCLVFAALAGRAEAAAVTLAWDPNSETDLARYYVGYRTSPTGSETLVQRRPRDAVDAHDCRGRQHLLFQRLRREHAGLRSAPSNEVSTTIPTTPPPPSGGGLALERGALNFGSVNSSGSTLGPKTPAQRMMVTQTASGAPLAWTAASVGTGSTRITVSPSSGSGTAPLTVTLASTSLAAGTYTNTVRVTIGSTQLNVPVTTRVYAAGGSTGAGRLLRHAG